MSGKLEWFPWYPWRWLGSQRVRLMPPEARGYYATLLCEQWVAHEDEDQPGRGLPNNVRSLAVLAGAQDKRQFTAVWKEHLSAMFAVCDDGMLRNRTMWEVWQRQCARARKLSASGSEGAARRWGTGLQKQMASPSVTNANASSSSSITAITGGTTGGKEVTPAPPPDRHVHAARKWLVNASRADADRVRSKVKERLGYPADWDLRKLPQTSGPLRLKALVDILTEEGYIDGG